MDAVRRELNRLPIDGTIVIGEGPHHATPTLFVGEKVGTRAGPRVDIAVDPLEGTTLCAKDLPGSIAVIAMAQPGALLQAPDVYMDKIAIGPGYPAGVVDLDRSPEDNIRSLAKAKGVPPGEITVAVLDRPRHALLIAGLPGGRRLAPSADGRGCGGRDLHHAARGHIGRPLPRDRARAPEGVLAAGALRCVGGQMQGPPVPRYTREPRAGACARHHRSRRANTT